MAWLETALSIASSVADAALFCLCIWLFLRPQRNTRAAMLTYIVASTVMCMAMDGGGIPYQIKMACVLLMDIVLCYVTSRHFGASVFWSIFYLALMTVCESAVPIVAVRFERVHMLQGTDSPWFQIYAILLSRSLLYLLLGILLAVVQKVRGKDTGGRPKALRPYIWVLFCAGIGLLGGFVALFEYHMNRRTQDELEFLWAFPIVFLVLIVIFAVLGLQLMYSMENWYNLQTMLRHTEMRLQHQDELAVLSGQMQGLRHDLMNHLQVIRALAQKGDTADITDYVDRIEKNGGLCTVTVHTGNPHLDALLSTKLAIAKEKGIQMRCDLQIPQELKIEMPDLCTIIFNMLDNAFEACARNKAPENWTVAFRMQQNREMLLIECSNPSELKPVQRGERYQTTKTAGLHGIGLRQIAGIAEKYDGYFNGGYQNGVFCARVVMPNEVEDSTLQISHVFTKEESTDESSETVCGISDA